MSFIDQICDRALEFDSRIIVGLDLDIKRFPIPLCKQVEDSPNNETIQAVIYQFNELVIDVTHKLAVAYKPQTAFYE